MKLRNCKKCGKPFPVERCNIDGKIRDLRARVYCLVCSPFGWHKSPKDKPNQIWEIKTEDLQETVNNSSSITEVLEKLGVSTRSSYRQKEIRKRFEVDNINLIKLKENSKHKLSNYKMPISDILIKDSPYTYGSIKRRIIKENILPYKCAIPDCQISEWHGKKLSLQLDHINGDCSDSRLENLRFLCPNCHSLTPTWTGKNINREKREIICVDCKSIIAGRNSTRCRKCYAVYAKNNSTRKLVISKQEMISMLVAKKSFSVIGEQYGVTGNAVKKLAKQLGVKWMPHHPQNIIYD